MRDLRPGDPLTHPLAAVAAMAAAVVAMSCSDRTELLGTRDAPSSSDAGLSLSDAGSPPAEAGPPPSDAGSAPSDAGLQAEAATRTLIVVAADGGGDFTTLQAAVDSIPSTATAPIQIDLRAGTYREKVAIGGAAPVSLVGDDPLTTIITYDQDANDAGGTARSASASIASSDFLARNITFQNTTPQTGAQAVALYATGQRQQFSNCRFISYQDTLYLGAGSQYFRDCYIEGDDDFILGPATAVFQSCSVYSSSGGVAVTAPSTDANSAYGFVFFGGQLTAASSVRAASVALGRPWGAQGSTIFIGTNLGAHILPAGWVPMPPNDLSLARFAEYGSTGPGAAPSMRAPPSRQLTGAQAAGISVSTVFGGWVPSLSP